MKNNHKNNHSVRSASAAVPAGFYAVDKNALQAARQGVPTGEYHA